MQTQRDYTPAARMWQALAIAAILVLAASAPVQAEQTSRINQKDRFASELFNQCAPQETVSFEGFIHFNQKTMVANDGTIHFVQSDKMHGQGLGNVTLLKYTVGSMLTSNTKVPGPGPFFIRQRTRLVRQSGADNMFVTFVFRVEPGKGTQLTFELDCRG